MHLVIKILISLSDKIQIQVLNYDDFDDFDLQTPDFDRKRQLSRSMNDDVCYYLKPPSTALLNVKVSQRLFKVWIFQEVIYYELISVRLWNFKDGGS